MLTYAYAGWLIARAVFQHWTGRALIRIGMWVRPLIPPEAAHCMFLAIVEWTYWRPEITPSAASAPNDNHMILFNNPVQQPPRQKASHE